MKHCSERYLEFINDKLSKLSLCELIQNIEKYDKTIINKTFKENIKKYREELKINEDKCIVDLSNETFKNNKTGYDHRQSYFMTGVIEFIGKRLEKSRNYF
ncbi:hypothetical protein [Flavobacterium croceum]|uniref:hypothetical protein n=1 Tax=Flavobacterium croceum TaxID=370975 RepID=UPI0024A7CE92|nr:hypothetical protein [Flavobacterium croceum]